MARRPARADGVYIDRGHSRASGFMATLKESMSWDFIKEDVGYKYYSNSYTGDRKAVPKEGLIPRDARPDYEWLEEPR